MRKINLKFKCVEFDVLREYIHQFSNYIIGGNSMMGAYYFETLHRLWVQMAEKSTMGKKSMTISVSISEAAVLVHMATYYDSMDPVEVACLLTLLEQIEHKSERYVAEMRELKKRVL